jgi:hypothetical protein
MVLWQLLLESFWVPRLGELIATRKWPFVFRVLRGQAWVMLCAYTLVVAAELAVSIVKPSLSDFGLAILGAVLLPPIAWVCLGALTGFWMLVLPDRRQGEDRTARRITKPALACLLLVVLAPVSINVYRMYRSASAASDAYSDALVAGRPDVAYDLLSIGLRNTISREELARVQAGLARRFGRLKGIRRTYVFNVGFTLAEWRTAEFRLVYMYEKHDLQASLFLRYFHDQWRVEAFQIP